MDVLKISGSEAGAVKSFVTKLESLLGSAKDLVDAACTKLQLDTEAASETTYCALRKEVEMAELRARKAEAEARIVKARADILEHGEKKRALEKKFKTEKQAMAKQHVAQGSGPVKQGFKQGTHPVRPPRREQFKNDALKQELQEKLPSLQKVEEQVTAGK